MKTLSINHSDSAAQYNFADALYKIYESKHRTVLKYTDLNNAYRKLYGQTLKTKQLTRLPFIRFGQNLNDHNMVYLLIEIDDICDGCKTKECELLHSFSPDHEFQSADGKMTIIQIPNISLLDRITEIFKESSALSGQMSITELKKIHNTKYPQFKSHQPTLQNIMQRFKSQFRAEYNTKQQDQMIIAKEIELHDAYDEKNEDNLVLPTEPGTEWFLERDSSDRKQLEKLLSLKETVKATRDAISPKQGPSDPHEIISRESMTRIDNWHYGKKKHSVSKPESPKRIKKITRAAISEFADVILKTSDSKIVSDVPLTIIPEQLHKFYLKTELSQEWKDKKLINHFLRHIRQNSGVYTSDVYLANRRRVGFFTAGHASIAAAFVRRTKEKEVKCWGRTIEAEVVRLRKVKKPRIGRKQSPLALATEGCRVKIKNINCVMQRWDFEEWVHWTTNTAKQRTLVTDIELCYPRKQRGTSQCICVFEYAEEVDEVLYGLKNVPFRGIVLKFERWRHGDHAELIRFKIDAMRQRQQEKEKEKERAELDFVDQQKHGANHKHYDAKHEQYYGDEYENEANGDWITTEVADMNASYRSYRTYNNNGNYY